MRYLSKHCPNTARGLSVLALFAFICASTAGCGLLDPTDIENPRTTVDDLAEAQSPTGALLPGLRAQFARAIGSVVTVDAVVSDDYSIQRTGLPKELDFPHRITVSEMDGTGTTTGIYWNLQELRALAEFVLTDIVPDDASATSDQVAEVRFYHGMALLLLAEKFVAVPLEEDGAPVPAATILAQAIPVLEQAAGHSGDIGTAATGAVARAHKVAGNPTEAANAASQLLASDPNFVFGVEYDATSLVNPPVFFLVIRTLQEMQPLPRLDFLDPKLLDREALTPVVKAEEMQLILAEAAMASGDWATGRSRLGDAIRLAQSRPVLSFDDADPRQNANLTTRPRDEEINVRADANSPYRAGLVLERPGVVQVPAISGTSLNPDSVEAIPVANTDEIEHALYLARQEILFLEGRRLTDLGIRLPMMKREVDANPAVTLGMVGTEVEVPSYVPDQDQIDQFSPATPYSGQESPVLDTTEITVLFDMNRLLVENRDPFDALVQ